MIVSETVVYVKVQKAIENDFSKNEYLVDGLK